MVVGLVQSALFWHFEQDLTNRHLIGHGHKKDLTFCQKCTIIGAGYTKLRFVTLPLAQARQNIDYD